MKPFTLWALALLLPSVGFAVAAVSAPSGAVASVNHEEQHRVVPQPSDWIPFSSELKNINENTGTVSVGHFYRASDGSTRSETGPSPTAITSIGIKNVPNATFYLWSSQRGWTSQPMELPPGGWHPLQRRVNERMKFINERVEGFDVVQLDHGGGRIGYQAPQLNFFRLVMTVPCTFQPTSLCGTWHSNINVGEQPPELFLPHVDSAIVPLTQPGGIVRRR